MARALAERASVRAVLVAELSFLWVRGSCPASMMRERGVLMAVQVSFRGLGKAEAKVGLRRGEVRLVVGGLPVMSLSRALRRW
jgi:hypothetical protein